ncbi:DUF3352 domain-containing protein [Acaryochloris sp. IP29b_bin.148]|uniref:DUF3352 domain-containing protein n=1 Tax=Acaryochloris sp. IP29b_bin.148 TaxID=2969218 RepID=UPI0026067754|nr:DUF3352 domain-containing protein [Acaryochloris sp. IP29b_bin.148]
MSERRIRPKSTQRKSKKKQPRSLLLTLGGAALLVIGGSVAFLLLQGDQKSGPLPLGAKVVPQDVMLSVTLSTEANQWQQLAKFGTTTSQKSWGQRIQTFENRVLEPYGLSYADNIRPWSANQVTMALLPPTVESVEFQSQQATVWVVPIRDQGQFEQKFKQKLLTSASQVDKRTYKQIDIHEFDAEDGKRYGFATLEDRWLVFTEADTPINAVVDTHKGKPALADVPRYQDALKEIESENAIARVYVNVPIAAAQMSRVPLSPASKERIQDVQAIGATVRLVEDGLRFKAISWLHPEAKETLKAKNEAKDIAKNLPQDTLMMASGGNFQQVWRDYAQGNIAKLVFPLNPKAWNDDLNQRTGVDFNNQFVNWMDGEFLSALVPSQDPEGQGVGVVLMAKAKDRATANQAFQALDDAMRDRFDFLVAESKIDNKTVITWKVPPGLPIASHGWLDNDVAFLTFGAPIANRLLQPPKENLTQAAGFKAATDSDLDPNNGHFFVDMPRMLGLLETNPLLPKLTSETTKVMQGIETIGVTTAIQNEWSTRYDIHVKLKKRS